MHEQQKKKNKITVAFIVTVMSILSFFLLDVPNIIEKYFNNHGKEDMSEKKDEGDIQNMKSTEEEDLPKKDEIQNKEIIIDKIIKEAEEVFNKDGYEAAILVIKGGLKEYSGEKRLLQELEKYEDYRPKPISQLEPIKNTATGLNDETSIDEYKEDKFNNKYLYSFSLSKGTVSYFLDGEYSLIKGTIACPKEVQYDNYRRSSTISISIDGYKKFTSNSMEVDTYPQTFEIDLTGAGTIEITWECEGANIWNDWGYYATLFDTYFYK